MDDAIDGYCNMEVRYLFKIKQFTLRLLKGTRYQGRDFSELLTEGRYLNVNKLSKMWCGDDGRSVR